MTPPLSAHFLSREPSAIRVAQMKFAKRTDSVTAFNTAIGNVSLPMHPAMQQRMFNLHAADSPVKNGVVKYSETVGFDETNRAFLNIIAASGFDTSSLYSQITDGGSQAIELVILGVCGESGSAGRPLMVIDSAYTNYASMAKRLGRRTVSIARQLFDDGKFTLPEIAEIETAMDRYQPGALLVIPYDNPTGQFINLEMMAELASLCVKHNLWLVSDEAYRELHYTGEEVSSIWGLSEDMVPGITGRRISIESTSKVWNACGLRIGAVITDNELYHQKSVAENTVNLCSSVIGQYVFGAIAHESHEQLQAWFAQQRDYYYHMLRQFTDNFKRMLPGVIVSSPEASIYSVVDVRNIVPPDFNAADFVDYCATRGKVTLEGHDYTLLVSPMAEFYTPEVGQSNPGRTQMRIAFVESEENMAKVPVLFKTLLENYLNL